MSIKLIKIVLALLLSVTSPAYLTPIKLQTRTINSIKLNIIYINLNNPKLSIQPAVAKPNESIDDMLERLKPSAAINGTYFHDYIDYKPITDIMVNKKLIYFGGIGTSMGISLSNKIEFIPTKRYKHSELEQQKLHVLTAGPQLIINKKIKLDPMKEGFQDKRLLKKRIRSAIGTIKHKYAVLVTSKTPCTLQEFAKALKDIGLTNAINLDGGSSTFLMYDDKMIQKSKIKHASSMIIVRTSNDYWWKQWRSFIY